MPLDDIEHSGLIDAVDRLLARKIIKMFLNTNLFCLSWSPGHPAKLSPFLRNIFTAALASTIQASPRLCCLIQCFALSDFWTRKYNQFRESYCYQQPTSSQLDNTR